MLDVIYYVMRMLLLRPISHFGCCCVAFMALQHWEIHRIAQSYGFDFSSAGGRSPVGIPRKCEFALPLRLIGSAISQDDLFTLYVIRLWLQHHVLSVSLP